jgi:hypothetical protein
VGDLGRVTLRAAGVGLLQGRVDKAWRRQVDFALLGFGKELPFHEEGYFGTSCTCIPFYCELSNI